MTREEAIANLKMIGVAFVDPDTQEQRKLIDDTFNMAISALKDIEKIQTIIDNYFNRNSHSGFVCMGEIDRILEPYKKGGE